MSTLATTNIKHPSSASNNIVLDSSARVGIGTASPQSLLHLETDGTALRIVRGSSTGFLYNTGTASTSTTRLQGNDGPVELYTNAAQPIVFSSNATERMRITSGGNIFAGGNTDQDWSSNGFSVLKDIGFAFTKTSGSLLGSVAVLKRGSSVGDGNLIEFLTTAQQGVISVSGTTVTYGGGHLARWSQLPNNEDPLQILKGTVMSNLDEMCEWGEEDNEQLNKTKISDVEGDPNVAGVFVSTSFDEAGPLDFFVGMTGDMIIRIAADTTVERGDLLMSAGDGTAKPQGDGYVQDKTIAKVTSTNVSCTYEDGSYCVPCVLMAC